MKNEIKYLYLYKKLGIFMKKKSMFKQLTKSNLAQLFFKRYQNIERTNLLE